MSEAQIAVLIDYENVGLGSVQGLFDQLSDLGRIIVKRAYADWSTGARQRDHVLELGIDPVHHFHAAKVAKNSSDISLAIDAVDLLYRSPVDTFVIVSADSDFVTLVSKLRSAGKTVIGAGRRDVVSTTLVRACDRYIYLEPGPRAAAVPPGRAIRGRRRPCLSGQSMPRRTMRARWPGSKLHQTITRIDPSFDFRSMGYRTFTQFLEASSAVKVTRARGSDDTSITLKPKGDRAGAGHRQGGVGRTGGLERTLTATVEARARTCPPSRHRLRPPQQHRRREGLGRPSALPVAPRPVPAPVQAAPPPPEPPTAPAPALNAGWESEVHNRWSQRVDKSTGILNGTRAAGDAARVLGADKLSASRYKTLQKLLAASPYLSARWDARGQHPAREGAGGRRDRLHPPEPHRKFHALDLERHRVVARPGRARHSLDGQCLAADVVAHRALGQQRLQLRRALVRDDDAVRDV